MFNTSLLVGETTNTASFAEMVVSESTDNYIYHLLEFNNDMHESDVELKCDYYRALVTEATCSDMAIVEGSNAETIRRIAESIRKALEAIIEFVKAFVNTFYNKEKKTKVQFRKKLRETENFSFKFDDRDFSATFDRLYSGNSDEFGNRKESKARYREQAKQTLDNIMDSSWTVTWYAYPKPQAIDDQRVRACITNITQAIEDICDSNGRDREPDIIELETAFKAMKYAIKGTRSEYSGSVTDASSYKQYVQSNVVYKEKKEMRISEYRAKILETGPIDFGKDVIADKVRGITEDLEKCKRKVENAKNTLDTDQLKHANTYIGYISKIVRSWTWFLDYASRAHLNCLRDFCSTYDRIMNAAYTGHLNESGMIHGEPFDSQTLFDNEDMRDFNPSEWTNLQLEAETYCIPYTLAESHRRMVLQEAVILTDDEPNKVLRIASMHEAEEKKAGIDIKAIIEKIRQIINNFITKIKSKFNLNANFIKRNIDIINKNPINLNGCKSNGDILAGMERVKTSVPVIPYNYEQLKDDLVDRDTFFKNQIMPKMKAGTGKRQLVQWVDGTTKISDYCKSYYGASMPEESYAKCEYTAAELEGQKRNMVEFCQNPSVFIKNVNSAIDTVKRNAEMASRTQAQEANHPSTQTQTTTQTQGTNQQQSTQNQTDNAGAKQEGVFSTLYGTYITEAEIEMGAKPEGEGAGETATNDNKARSNAIKVYVDTYNAVLMSQITAIEFIASEFMQILKAHVKVYATPEQQKAEAEAQAKEQPASRQQNVAAKEQPAAAQATT